MSGKTQKTSAKQEAKEIEILARAKRGLQLRKNGISYRDIADKLQKEGIECSYQTVRRDIKAALKILAEENKSETEEMRALQGERLEGLLLAHYSPAVGRIEVLKDPFGNPIVDPETDKPELKTHAPNVGNAYFALQVINSISDLFGLRVQTSQAKGKDDAPENPVYPMTISQWRFDVAKRRAEAARTEELFQDRTEAPPA